MRRWKPFILIMGMLTLVACSKGNATDHPPMVGEPSADKNTSKDHQPVTNEQLPSKIDHIVIVIEENHSQQQIAGNPSAPYMNSLMQQGANFTNYFAIEHPSQPNYLDLFSGSNQEVTSDRAPKTKFNTDNLANQLLTHHYTFAGYSEDLPYSGFNGESNSSGYARKHNPWVNFENIPKEANQPLTAFPKDFNQLPTVSFVIPNLKNDMHDGSVAGADEWLKTHINPYVEWAKTNNSLLIVTWDEDDSSHDNKIPTFMVGPMVKPGAYDQKVNHFQLLRTIEDIYGVSHVGKSAEVQPILTIWKENSKS